MHDHCMAGLHRQTHPGQEHPPASYSYFAPADALVGVS